MPIGKDYGGSLLNAFFRANSGNNGDCGNSGNRPRVPVGSGIRRLSPALDVEIDEQSRHLGDVMKSQAPDTFRSPWH